MFKKITLTIVAVSLLASAPVKAYNFPDMKKAGNAVVSFMKEIKTSAGSGISQATDWVKQGKLLDKASAWIKQPANQKIAAAATIGIIALTYLYKKLASKNKPNTKKA